MKQPIFAIIKKPGGGPEIRLIEKDHKTYSAVIEGKREVIPFPGVPGVCIVIDGEAVKTSKKANCFLPEYNDLLLGTVIFAGIDFETGFTSLTAGQAAKLEEYLAVNDAKGFNGSAEGRIASEYLPLTEENQLLGILSEVKTKHKTVRLKWMKR
jgi:hypothetical protein